MIPLPNPFESALAPARAADTATGLRTDPAVPVADYFESPATEGGQGAPAADMNPHAAGAADPFNDEPLPLFLTEPAPMLDRELEAMLRVMFGVST